MWNCLLVIIVLNLLSSCSVFGRKVVSAGISLGNRGEAGVTVFNTRTSESLQVITDKNKNLFCTNIQFTNIEII